jgi:viroplasmin and RNaseH domain-containing protein
MAQSIAKKTQRTSLLRGDFIAAQHSQSVRSRRNGFAHIDYLPLNYSFSQTLSHTLDVLRKCQTIDERRRREQEFKQKMFVRNNRDEDNKQRDSFCAAPLCTSQILRFRSLTSVDGTAWRHIN